MKRELRSIRGASLTIVCGSYGGFYIAINKGSFRLCLGWIAFTIYPYDMESAIDRIIDNPQTTKEEK